MQVGDTIRYKNDSQVTGVIVDDYESIVFCHYIPLQPEICHYGHRKGLVSGKPLYKGFIATKSKIEVYEKTQQD